MRCALTVIVFYIYLIVLHITCHVRDICMSTTYYYSLVICTKRHTEMSFPVVVEK
jgi:hypothetical protein